MSDQYLKKPNGEVIGRISTNHDNVQTLFRPNGSVAGYYRPQHDATFTVNGQLVGTGNLLTTLL